MFVSAGCKKNKHKTELEKLPPITQTGANTFGCLINGKVYIPKGYSGTGTPNPKISMEFFNGKLIFGIVTKQIYNRNEECYLIVSFFDTALLPGKYTFPENMNFSVAWPKVLDGCFTPVADSTVKQWGTGLISKLDYRARIVSGTFQLKFKTQNCDTVFITDGRFDFKFLTIK